MGWLGVSCVRVCMESSFFFPLSSFPHGSLGSPSSLLIFFFFAFFPFSLFHCYFVPSLSAPPFSCFSFFFLHPFFFWAVCLLAFLLHYIPCILHLFFLCTLVGNAVVGWG